MNNVMVYYCTKCGWYSMNKNGKDICPCCHSNLSEYNCKTKNYYMLPLIEQEAIKYNVINLIKNSPNFDPDLHDQLAEYARAANKTLKCPKCQSTYIEKNSLGDKVVSFQLFDGGSPMIGKKWHCRNCNTYF
ncbi:hypothetical protein [Diplocloster agilis]|uniref:Uncharacterized protein n=1 Tax=Diplocloster agilis TaxID=2850323 RepID=A0A949NGT3_9FIRM|nr:hypothetical protein [Diplocloster agilis]MBU9735060.1 hypothetical protein [Diplocloster agilis]MBU9742418.1 hypothetical protein [Diplocloster agilis]